MTTFKLLSTLRELLARIRRRYVASKRTARARVAGTPLYRVR